MINKNYFTLIIFFFALYACADKPVEEESKELRFSVLSYDAEISETLTLDKSEIQLDTPKEFYYWSKDYQNPQNNINHIFTSATLKSKKKIITGKKDPINIIQPVFFENTICNLVSNGFVECINTSTNKSKFKTDIKNDNIKKYEIIRGGLSYFDEKILFVDGYGQIILLDTNNGEIIWEKIISFPILSSPLIYRGYAYFVSLDNRLFAIEFDTGEIAWTFQTIAESKKNLSTASPVAFENIVVSPFSNGELIAFKYDDGTPLWSENVSKLSIISNFDIKDISANPVISSNNIYALSTNGKFLSINLINGKRNWSVEISGSNTPIISGDQIYILDNQSKLICLNRTTGEIYWITQLKKFRKGEKASNLNLWLGPYAINNHLYLISYFGELIILSPNSGEILDSNNLGINGIMVPPIILSDRFYLVDGNSNVYKFE